MRQYSLQITKINIFLIICCTIILNSCSTKKDILYFQDIQNNSEFINTLVSSKIQTNDILDIEVNSKVNVASLPFNNKMMLNGTTLNLDVLKIKGYLVNPKGYITLPIIGKVFVTDKTPTALESYLEKMLIREEHLIDASVSVRVINSKITVLGEVNKPGTYNFTEQNLTLLQAIGLAGDLTIDGKRTDLLRIRMDGETKTITKIDLTKTDWFNSPDFYVNNNDIIVINPNNSKVKSSNYMGSPSTILTIASLILSSIILIGR